MEDKFKDDVILKLEKTQKLAKEYNDDVSIAFMLELDSFLDNFIDMYHLN